MHYFEVIFRGDAMWLRSVTEYQRRTRYGLSIGWCEAIFMHRMVWHDVCAAVGGCAPDAAPRQRMQNNMRDKHNNR